MLRQSMFFVMTMLFTTVSVASELQGLWLTHDDDGKPTGYVRIIEANDVYQGVIEKGLETGEEEKYCTACSGELKDQKLVGMTMMKGVVDKGNGHYQGGEILDPFSGNTYRVKLKLKDAGQTLDVRGYIGISLFGRTQTWKRANNGK